MTCSLRSGEMLTTQPFDITTFSNDEGYDELVLARDIPFHSLCEHHLLPFHGVAHVGYVPAHAGWLEAHLAPKGVGVVLEAEHVCMSLRGVHATGARTVTSSVHGVLRDDARSRQEFFALARAGH